jgi:DNA-binding response OmpR family regulator
MTDAAGGPAISTSVSRVLVIDDDATLSEVVARYLERDGFAVTRCADGRHGLQTALDDLPDLVVLDLMLPGIDGFEVFRRLREVAPIPVVMLTARGDEDDRVAGLELGADDYVAKPFSPRELAARVRAVLRRANGGVSDAGDATLRAGSLVVDVRAHDATCGGRQLMLTAKEFDLLAWLMRHPNQAFHRQELLEHVWGYKYGDTATVTVHMRRLREKVEDDPSAPRHLCTVRGVGYRFQA